MNIIFSYKTNTKHTVSDMFMKWRLVCLLSLSLLTLFHLLPIRYCKIVTYSVGPCRSSISQPSNFWGFGGPGFLSTSPATTSNINSSTRMLRLIQNKACLQVGNWKWVISLDGCDLQGEWHMSPANQNISSICVTSICYILVTTFLCVSPHITQNGQDMLPRLYGVCLEVTVFMTKQKVTVTCLCHWYKGNMTQFILQLYKRLLPCPYHKLWNVSITSSHASWRLCIFFVSLLILLICSKIFLDSLLIIISNDTFLSSPALSKLPFYHQWNKVPRIVQ